jgi:hypothetical protein
MLGGISEEEYYAGRRLFSAIVVNQDTGIPGQSFLIWLRALEEIPLIKKHFEL